jgi:hypothetical protein
VEDAPHLKTREVPDALRRRTPEERQAYLDEKTPAVAKKFGVSEEEARELLAMSGGAYALEPDATVGPAPVTPATGSIRFVLTRENDETLNFSIEFEGQGGEDITTVTHDEYGWSGIDLIKDTVKSIGEALGIEVAEQ